MEVSSDFGRESLGDEGSGVLQASPFAFGGLQRDVDQWSDGESRVEAGHCAEKRVVKVGSSHVGLSRRSVREFESLISDD
jgi:hypothetical protein